MHSPAGGLTATRPRPGRGRRCRISTLAVAVALGVLAAACTGSDGVSAPPGSEMAPASATVKIADGEFDPRVVEVAVGGSVTWVNDDVTAHLLVSTTPNVIQSPLIGKAGTYTREFTEPGEYRYYCNIHNSMKGVVVVR